MEEKLSNFGHIGLSHIRTLEKAGIESDNDNLQFRKDLAIYQLIWLNISNKYLYW